MKTKKTLLKAILFIAPAAFITSAGAQTATYDNFEGTKHVQYTMRAGVLDTLADVPSPNSINGKGKCAKYTRNGEKKFDVIKMNLDSKLADISNYATYMGEPPKLKMKVYTTAPVGTLVEILLGNKLGNNAYPAGTNSQYQAYTTVSGAWEELTFKFAQIPEGSETPTTEVDQITLLFNPNSLTKDTYYFDEITGPVLTAKKDDAAPAKSITKTETKTEPNGASKTNGTGTGTKK